MIYFLVNNNYHLINVFENCNNLKDYKKSLIQVPHTLDKINNNKFFVNIFTYDTPFNKTKNFLNLYRIKKIEKQIKDNLKIKPNDILFVSTEYEILNQYIISLFKMNNAKVYILDEGLATYLTYSMKSDKQLPLKVRAKLFYTKYILNYNFVEYLYINNLVYPLINERYIDGVFLYLDVNIVRNINKYIIKKDIKKKILNSKNAIFLNQDMYYHYYSKEEHEVILEDILLKMSNSFQKIYFKFHPRETEVDKNWQLKILSKFKKIYVIDENLPIETIVEKYDAKYIFSFLSAALLNLNAVGIIPVYIYHLYQNISKNSIFEEISNILINSKYIFIDKKFNNILDVGFKNSLENNSENIKDLLVKEVSLNDYINTTPSNENLSNPLISIITVVYNGEKYIERTIQNILNQDYLNIQYIIIDGGSRDGTLDIIKKYEKRIYYIVSEKDCGIYDAMNKGIKIATGDWINFMNAGDIFYNKYTVSNIVKTIDIDVDLIYGDIEIEYPNFSRFQKAGNLKNLWKGMQFSHQSIFTKTSLLKRREFNLLYKITADFDCVYYLWKNSYKFKYIPIVIGIVDSGGLSDINRVNVYKEYLEIVGKHKVKYKYYFYTQICKTKIKNLIKTLLPKYIVNKIIKMINNDI